MIILKKWDRNIRTIARAVVVLVATVTVVGMSVTWASANDRDEHHGRKEYKHRVYHHRHGREVRDYPGAVYAPPAPVVYAPPPPPPGISIVFPIHIR